MTKRQLLAALSILTLLVVLVAGCSQPAPAPKASPAPAPAATAKPSPAPSPTASPAPAPKPAAKEIRLRMGTGQAGESSNAWATALAVLAEKHSPSIRIDLMPTKGTIERLHFLEEGKVDLAGIVYEYNVAAARAGTGGFTDLGKTNKARILYSGTVAIGHVLVLSKSPITAFTNEQIKGKKVIVREAGSSALELADTMLRGINIDPQKDVKLLMLNQNDGCSALSDGTGDILMSLQGIPSGPINDVAISKGARFLSVPQSVLDRTREVMGAAPGDIPAGTYKGLDKAAGPVPVIAGLFLASEKLDSAVAYELAKLWWEFTAERNAVHPSIKTDATSDWLQKAVAASKTPVHPGALKYYQEKGWLK